VFMLLICVCLWTGLSWWFHCTGAVVVLLYPLHPLVTLLQYLQKMHGMNNLKMYD